MSTRESGDIGSDEPNTQAGVAVAVSQTDVTEEVAFRSDGPQCARVCTRVESQTRNSRADRATVTAGRPASGDIGWRARTKAQQEGPWPAAVPGRAEVVTAPEDGQCVVHAI